MDWLLQKATGKPSITWTESVDEALCFGWIDGIRKTIDDERYKIRFTPRRPGSHWSAKNLASIERLFDEKRVRQAGAKVYEKRKPANEKRASYEQGDPVELPSDYKTQVEANGAAWAYFQAATPSYRKQVIWWIVSAKKEETRLRRLSVLIKSSADGKVIPPLRWTVKKKK